MPSSLHHPPDDLEPAPTETSPLLVGDGNREEISTSNGDEEEAGEEGDHDNPLFDGKPEVSATLPWLMPGLAIGIFLGAADQTIVVSSYGKIGSDLKALENTSWIATAYFLTLTSFQPLYGKLSDIFGRKPALLFAYAVFGLGCILCGFARNLKELVISRAIAGIGGGGMNTVTSIIMSDIIPLRQRGLWQGYVNIIFAAGASAGAPLGGLLADSIGWRWSFLGQGPLTFLAFFVVYFVLDLPKIEDTHWRSQLSKIDFLGAFTLITAVFSLLLGLDRGSNDSWTNPIAITGCSISLPLFALFVLVEMKVASHPFAPGHIIFERSLFASYASNFFTMASHMIIIFYVPLCLQAVEGLSATGAGLRLIPVMIGAVSGSLFGGRVMQKTGRYYWLTVGCIVFSIAGTIVVLLCSGVPFHSSWGMIVGLSIAAFGSGATITTTLINVIANAAPQDQAIATACTYLFRSLGSVLGLSLASTVVQQSLRTQLRSSLDSGHDADEIVDRVRQSLDYIKELEPQTRSIVRLCYQRATSASFGMSIIVFLGAEPDFV
ncbi:hypothetical protein B7494_g459 [Chlorociboria aeruginascens]|nr:hypothetical protein B7494_g459 [Chlorociboria aeruginascens]